MSLRLLKATIEIVPDGEPDRELAELGEDGLPVAWRIFRPGWNESRNGPALFDEVAARLVMADYREHGARVQVDRNHRSLNTESASYDDRAYGWHKLELREDGSLWAVEATWTELGAGLLASKAFRYYSPAFSADDLEEHGEEPDRVISLFNGGIVGTPATDQPMALMAASRRKGHKSMNSKAALKAYRAMSEDNRSRIKAMMALTESQRGLPSSKLAGLLKWQDGEDIDPKVLQKIVAQIPGADASAGIGGLLRQLRGFVKAVESALMGSDEPAPEAVPTEGEPEAMADNPEDKRDEQLMAASRQQSAELRKLRAEQEADRKLLKTLRAERDAEQLQIRRELVAKACDAGLIARELAWEDETAEPDKLMPRGMMATTSLDELKAWASSKPPAYGGLLAPGPTPASGGYTGAITQPGLFEVSDYEMKRLEVAAKKSGRDLAWATRRYRELRTMQCRGAAGNHRSLQVLGRKYIRDYAHPDAARCNVALADVSGNFTPDDLERYRSWASQAPIETHSAVSIAAMREFDTRYNIAAATPGINWAEVIGDIRPSGSIGDKSFPLDFETIFYEKKADQATGHETPTLWWIDVRTERYAAGAQASIELLNEPNSYDYMMETWLRKADRMATARWDLQQLLAVAVLVDNPYLYEQFLEGSVKRLTGKRFFATDHPIHPFKKEKVKDINGATTWSNYETSATPFTPEALTAQKTQFNLTPNDRGRFMSMPVTHVVCPTVLLEEVTNKLSIQDLILAGALTQDSGAGVGTMGTVRSPHTGSGLLPLEVQHLPGADLTADWYLFSTERKAAGFVPFAVCESNVEKVFVYGPETDFALDTGHIKERRETDIRAVPIHPQALRKIAGS